MCLVLMVLEVVMVVLEVVLQLLLLQLSWGAVYVYGSDGPGGGSAGPGDGYKVWGMVRMVRPNHPNHPVICTMPTY